MPLDRAKACSSLAKGWKARGLSGAAIEKAHQKCLRNFRQPGTRRKKKSK